MREHLKSFSAVFPIIIKEGKMLLHRRQNTGYEDGKWDIAGSGHVDNNETARTAVVRECREELGITVEPEDLEFAHLSQRLLKDRTYYDLYFTVRAYCGTPNIMEPDKCSELKWFAINDLPDDTIGCRKQDIQNCIEKRFYSEKTEN